MYRVSELADVLGSNQVRFYDSASEVEELVYDTRKILTPSKSVFFALEGSRDGHEFVGVAYDLGVRNFVVSAVDFDTRAFASSNFIYVEDTLRALQRLAAFHRAQCQFPVVGITGSNGKTTVKEWLYEMLSSDMEVYQSPKSYNSQLGVALSLCGIQQKYDVALIEAGISLPKEMELLARMIRPNIGVLTSLGDAHAAGFESKEQKLREKLQLFTGADCIVLPSVYVRDSIDIDALFGRQKCLLWGTHPEDDIVVLAQERRGLVTRVRLSHLGSVYNLKVPFGDSGSVENVLTCVAVLVTLGYEWPSIEQHIWNLRPLDMRLKLKKGIHSCSIIDDSYSNDLGSLKIALDFLSQQHQHPKNTLILSEFAGSQGVEKLTSKMVNLIGLYRIDRLIWIGSKELDASAMPIILHQYASTDDFLADFESIRFDHENVLVKGSRAYQFERIVQRLTARSHGTVLEVNLNALSANLKSYRDYVPKDVKMMAMVKAFSYGSGSYEVANILEYNNIDYLTVAFADEGVELREGGIELPIMVLSPELDNFENIVRYRLEPEIFSFSILHNFMRYLEERGVRNYPIHLKLDTGMHRLGFLPEELEALMSVLESTDLVYPVSTFSHLVAAADDRQDEFTRRQIDVFKTWSSRIEERLGRKLMKHICNTSGIEKWPDAYFDMVRLGLGLYGISASGVGNIDLRSVGQLKTVVTQLKELKAGETVGYDRKGVLKRDSRIATVKIGYADGYDRRFGNGVGKMLVNNCLVPTVGNICMDMCMLDVTGVDVNEDDEVLVFDDWSAAASAIGAIPYELLVGISHRVKREYYFE